MNTCILFRKYVMNYCDNPEKMERIKQYETKYGIQQDTPIEAHPFYKDYLSKFDIDWEFATPDGMELSSQEWDLLARLVFGSFSSNYTLSLDEGWKKDPTGKVKVNLGIAVTCEGNKVTRTIDELWSFQISRLFSIYLNEQIEFIRLIDNEDEKGGVNGYDPDLLQEEREKHIRTYKTKKENLMAEAESHQKMLSLFPWLIEV